MENNNRILRVNMANIRRKLEKNPAQPEYIFTEIGVGYRMIEPEGCPKQRKQEENERCELEWDMMCIDCRRAAN